MDLKEVVAQVSSDFRKEREELETKIAELKSDYKTPKKKKSLEALIMKESFESHLRALQLELMNKADEVEEFQTRIVELMQKNPSNLPILVQREYQMFQKHLPVYRFRREILESILKNDVTIVVADTGSGKSTLMTQFLHAQDENSIIYCCQPRKIAATSLVDYTNVCLDEDPKDALVAYDFNDWESNYVRGVSKIVYTTNSGLLSRWKADNQLKDIDIVVIDETHERTLSTDLLLGIMKQIHKTSHLRERPIKTIVMSATIDPSVFYDYFVDSNVTVHCIAIPGKTYPVQLLYDEIKLSDEPEDYLQRTVDKVLEILQEHESGDILAFLATPLEIELAMELIEDKLDIVGRVLKAYALHGGVELENRQKLFTKKGFEHEQRVILSTNIAETSITLPDIMFVIDSGRQKEFAYDLVKNVGSLQLSPISQSSALQRTGRAGRTRPGICYRLYTREDFELFPPGRIPEILSLPLDQALLSLFHLGFTTPRTFDFIDPPSSEAISVGIDSLISLNAIKIDEDNSDVFTLTEVGNKMTKFTLPPKLSHLIVNTLKTRKDLILEILVICGVLSSSDSIFYRSKDFLEAKMKKIKFCNEQSDFLTMINAFKTWYSVPKNGQTMWSRKNMISSKTMFSVSRFIHQNIKRINNYFNAKILVKNNNFEFKSGEDHYDDVLKLVYMSFKRSVAVFSGHPKTGYINYINGESMILHPSSGINCLESRPLDLLCYDKILTTSRTYIFHASQVKNDWLQKGDILFNEKVKSKIVCKREDYTRLGQYTIKKYVFPKLKKLVNEFKKNASTEVTNLLEIDINLEAGTLLTWCHSENKELAGLLIQNLLAEAREEVGNEKIDLPIPNTESVIRIGTGGLIVDHFYLHHEASFQIVDGNAEGSVKWNLGEIEALLKENQIIYYLQRSRKGPIFSFRGVSQGVDAKKVINEKFPHLNCVWSNERSAWLIFNFKHHNQDYLIESFQKFLDERYKGAVAIPMSSKKCGRVDVRVNVPTREMAKLLFERTLNSGMCGNMLTSKSFTLLTKNVYKIPTRAADFLKKEILSYNDKSRFNNYDDMTVVSTLSMQYSRYETSDDSYEQIEFAKMIKGSLVLIDNFSPSFNLEDHWTKFGQIESLNNVVVVQESQHECLSFRIFGRNSARIGNAISSLKSYFVELEGTNIVIPFDTREGHRGVLPILFKKFGTNLLKISQMEGISGVNIDNSFKTIQISGEKDVIGKVKEEIDVILTLKVEKMNQHFDSCVICGEPSSKKADFRLQLCGHKVCFGGCLQMLAVSYDFPLKCPDEECNEELTVFDIKTALGEGESAQIVFHKKASAEHLLPPHIIRCPSKCSHLFKKEEVEKENPRYCQNCSSPICTKCYQSRNYLCNCTSY